MSVPIPLQNCVNSASRFEQKLTALSEKWRARTCHNCQRPFPISLRSKRFQSSYCAKVRAEAKKRLKREGEERRGSPVIHFFCSCPSFLAEPREETLATQASSLQSTKGKYSRIGTCHPTKVPLHDCINQFPNQLTRINSFWLKKIYFLTYLPRLLKSTLEKKKVA